MPGNNKKVTHTYTNLQLNAERSAIGLLKYVWPFCYHQALWKLKIAIISDLASCNSVSKGVRYLIRAVLECSWAIHKPILHDWFQLQKHIYDPLKYRKLLAKNVNSGKPLTFLTKRSTTDPWQARAVFKTLSKICDGTFCENSLQLFADDNFWKKLHHIKCL